jgi:hypothetical protein
MFGLSAFLMCCLYYLTRPRDELHPLLAQGLPLGEIYLHADPPRMLTAFGGARSTNGTGKHTSPKELYRGSCPGESVPT